MSYYVRETGRFAYAAPLSSYLTPYSSNGACFALRVGPRPICYPTAEARNGHPYPTNDTPLT